LCFYKTRLGDDTIDQLLLWKSDNHDIVDISNRKEIFKIQRDDGDDAEILVDPSLQHIGKFLCLVCHYLLL
jgi:hypothetical protein